MAFEIFSPGTTITARNRNRSVFASAGVVGGRSGALSTFCTRRNGEIISHGNTDVIHCQPGDVVEVRGPGAGGYGLPSKRDVAAVLQDVRCGYLSIAAARREYGVVVTDNRADPEATARLRASMPQQPTCHFEHGEARQRFEALWTPARYELLTAFLASAPVSWRHFLKTQVFRGVEESGETAEMAKIFSELRQRYPAIANS